MRDYAELITRLKQSDDNCNAECCECSGECLSSGCNIFSEAADAIEELLARVNSVVKCKDCEWWTKQEASIQGRCARLAIYPTGEFYCAAGSKAEPPKEVLPNGEV